MGTPGAPAPPLFAPPGFPAARACQEPGLLRLPLRHLTRRHYENTMRDLLGGPAEVGRALPPDEHHAGFEVGRAVSPLLAQAWLERAELEGVAVSRDPSRVLPCDPRIGEETCARQFIKHFGARAYRRPLETAEEGRLLAIYTFARTGGTFAEGVGAVVQAALSAPQFLYHLESAPTVRLPSAVVANRLSYFLWGTLPDGPLFNSQLDTPAQLEVQVRRMLKDPRARQGLEDFFSQWLGLGDIEQVVKDKTLHPGWSPGLGRALSASLMAQIGDVLWSDAGTSAQLLEGKIAFANAAVGPLLGVSAMGATLRATSPPPLERAGILTHPALLATLAHADQSDPVRRGKFVRELMLCEVLPSPPGDVNVEIPDRKPGLSTRERFSRHSRDPACSGCHRLLDGVGFGFEAYDAIGQYRRTDDGRPVDLAGEVVGSRDVDGAFSGAPALASRLARSQAVRSCLARKLSEYATPGVSFPADSCFDDRAGGAEQPLRELVVRVATAGAFTNRALP